jgi:hypothetical protein
MTYSPFCNLRQHADCKLLPWNSPIPENCRKKKKREWTRRTVCHLCLNAKFQQQGVIDSVWSGANKLDRPCVIRKITQYQLITILCYWSLPANIRYVPGQIYRFLRAHSSRRDANFLNGAPEFSVMEISKWYFSHFINNIELVQKNQWKIEEKCCIPSSSTIAFLTTGLNLPVQLQNCTHGKVSKLKISKPTMISNLECGQNKIKNLLWHLQFFQ